MAYPPSPSRQPKQRQPSAPQDRPPPPRSASCALILALGWGAVATVGMVLLLALFILTRAENARLATAMAGTGVAGAEAIAEIGASATALVLTASVTATPTDTPLPTATPSPSATPTNPYVATATAVALDGMLGTRVAQTLTALPAFIVALTPTHTPQPTIAQVAQATQQAVVEPPPPAVPVTLTNFVCRPGFGQPNTYQLLGTVTNVSGTAFFVEFQAQADIGGSRNFPLGPGAQWVIPEGSPNPAELIYVQFTAGGTGYLRVVARLTECPGGDCNGVAGSPDSPTYVLIEGARDQLCK